MAVVAREDVRHGTLGFVRASVWLAGGHLEALLAVLKVVVGRSVRLIDGQGSPTEGFRRASTQIRTDVNLAHIWGRNGCVRRCVVSWFYQTDGARRIKWVDICKKKFNGPWSVKLPSDSSALD